jgi:quercetin dioxygenase-like cupin family protein
LLLSAFDHAGTIPPQQIWGGVVARSVTSERMTLALIELEPNAVVPEHSHENEQLGIVIEGSLTFTVGDETRELGPGQAWCITKYVPHSVVSGPDGAVLVEVFSPVRDDWAGLVTDEPRPARWPRS